MAGWSTVALLATVVLAATINEARQVSVQQICEWLSATMIATDIRESDIVFSLIESAHVLGLGLMVGTIVLVDLRMLGLILRREPVETIIRSLTRLTWLGFLVMFSSGSVLFFSEAGSLYGNKAFRFKLLLLGIAGVNQYIFNRTSHRRMSRSAKDSAPPVGARVAAVLSLICWAGTIVSGRAIAYLH